MLDEKKRKLKLGEELERIDTLGQESEKKAVKWVKEDNKRQKKAHKDLTDSDLTKLDSKRRQIITYKEELARILYQRLSRNDWPQGYNFLVNVTPKGIEIHIKNAQNKWFGRGITVTGVPEYDLNAAVVLVVQADNTISVSEKRAKEVNGRIAPL